MNAILTTPRSLALQLLIIDGGWLGRVRQSGMQMLSFMTCLPSAVRAQLAAMATEISEHVGGHIVMAKP
jgi:hypothetical protein